uniref:Uncharacterized protein n=1 Tax=Globodera rostochiensis TaxID=31243 RepID=A0A914I2N5_GLORO
MHSVAICIILLTNVTLETFGCSDGEKAREYQKRYMDSIMHKQFIDKCYEPDTREKCKAAKFTNIEGTKQITCYWNEEEQRCMLLSFKPVPAPAAVNAV